MDVEKLIKVYVKIRDARSEKKAAFEEEDSKLKAQQEAIEAELMNLCKETNTNTLSTGAGRATRKVQRRFWTSDWDSMYKFVKEHDAIHLLEKRVAQKSMEDFIEANGGILPDGMNVESKYVITVTRK